MVIAVEKGLGAEGISNDFLGILAAIGSAGTYALSLVLLRARTGSDPITTIVVLQNFLTALIILPIAFFLSDPVAAIVAEWPYVLMMGLLGTAGQFALASALRAAPAARIGTVEFTNIIWATLIGIFFFGEWPGITAYLGAALIIFAAFILLRKATPKISIAGDGL
jgi:S-adenosylmethionine uptake transporter